MPRSPEPAREALIAVAERLFAERGVDAVTVRDIVKAAGQRNSSAVQYHFGNKAGLLQAILNPHQARLDARRAEMFDELGERPALYELIEVLVRPLASLLDSESGRHYIRIRAQLVSAARLPSDSDLMRDLLASADGRETANEPRPGIRRVAQPSSNWWTTRLCRTSDIGWSSPQCCCCTDSPTSPNGTQRHRG